MVSVTVETVVACEICNEALSSSKSLKRHKKLVHGATDEEMKQCTLCDFETREKSNLDKHHEAQHSGRLQTCPDCTFTTKYSGNLIRHRKALHGHRPNPKATKKDVKDVFRAAIQGKVAAKKSMVAKKKRTVAAKRSHSVTVISLSPTETPGPVTPAYQPGFLPTDEEPRGMQSRKEDIAVARRAFKNRNLLKVGRCTDVGDECGGVESLTNKSTVPAYWSNSQHSGLVLDKSVLQVSAWDLGREAIMTWDPPPEHPRKQLGTPPDNTSPASCHEAQGFWKLPQWR